MDGGRVGGMTGEEVAASHWTEEYNVRCLGVVWREDLLPSENGCGLPGHATVVETGAGRRCWECWCETGMGAEAA